MADPNRPLDQAAPPAPTGPDASGGPDAVNDGPAAPVDPIDVGRRRFFRQFAGEMANTAATMLGAAQALQRTSAELAGAILDPARLALEETAVSQASAGDPSVPAFRTSFRVERGQIRFVDQRALPGAVVEHPAGSAAEVAWAIRNDVVIGGPASAQAAAVGLALTADRVRTTRPYARRATLRGAANALKNSAQTPASLRWAVDRSMAAYAAVGELSEDGDAVAEALDAEAQRIIAESTADHGRLVEAGFAALDAFVVRARSAAPTAPTPPIEPEGPAEASSTTTPLRLLVHGPSGTLAGGQFGTALAIAVAAHHAEREVLVVVPEGRPGFVGARVSCWELAAAGVPHVLVADAAAPSLIASGDVDAVIVAAERVAANGDVAAVVGAYPLAAVAARHGVPFLVCAPLSTIDPATPDGGAMTIGTRPAATLELVGGIPIAPRGTEVRVPTHDVTPAALVTAYITGDRVRGAPFEPVTVGAPDGAAEPRAAEVPPPSVPAASTAAGRPAVPAGGPT